LQVHRDIELAIHREDGEWMPFMRMRATPERVSMFSDGVFAVLITVLVLELRPPSEPSYSALLELWPRWLSYAVSYLFIAIVWVNHHYLMRYATEATPRLLWFNFAHLFSMSLLPLSTAWMATSELAPQPVSFYAAVFFLVNVTYVGLIWELNPAADASAHVRRVIKWRSLITLGLFGSAAVIALRWPMLGLAICIGCLAVYLKPDPGR
jgi:uncharacterized membrane protein